MVSSAIEVDSSFVMSYLEINLLNDHIGYKARIHEKTLILKHPVSGFYTDASSSSEEEETSSGNVFGLSHFFKTVARDFFLCLVIDPGYVSTTFPSYMCLQDQQK